MGKYDALKKKLETRRTELSDRLDRIKKDLTRSYNPDSKEQAQERENDEVLNQLSVEVAMELRDVNSSLDRMKNSQYGVCVKCAADIPLARLEIKPEASTCVTCA